jgi:hypothetical protein
MGLQFLFVGLRAGAVAGMLLPAIIEQPGIAVK